MTVMERLAASIVVPVVVLDKVEDAIPTARAMAAGGVDTMEITFRTAAAADSIQAVAEACPDMLVGAGTILNVEQCKLAIEMGAKFIVSPGFDADVVRYCIENGVAVTPGCVTPTEITAADMDKICADFVDAAVTAKAMGFDGKSLINPKQIRFVHEVFAPTEKEIVQAEQMVRAYRENVAKGLGVFTVNGKMVDIAFIPGAERTLRLAKAVGLYEGDLV